MLEGEGKVVDSTRRRPTRRCMTFIVVETTWRDAGSKEPVVTEKFNLIGRTRKG